MEDKGQENSRELVQGNEFLAKWRRGEGPRTITEYLFPDLPFNRISSDETIEGLSVEEENALVGMVHFFYRRVMMRPLQRLNAAGAVGTPKFVISR